MSCSRCHAENPPGMKFCGHCGAPLGRACPQNIVSGPLAPEPGPGRGMHAQRVLPGEMKQVTVLFCDIVGSTLLTDRLGSEGMRDLVSSFLNISLAEVHR